MAITQAVVLRDPTHIAALRSCRARQVPRCQFARLNQVSLNDLDMVLAVFAHDVRRPLLFCLLFRLGCLLLHGLQLGRGKGLRAGRTYRPSQALANGSIYAHCFRVGHGCG